ncbi:hypothetical protein [Salipiger sp. PrR003]|uniref:hypothetical protein n=1 Tax=Salipiger sp. PrR003 TaxID=2706776 RepID=UPI0013D9704D|nr:hypothetical protein [Salipiger sp. PrR003]NDV51518.1 hypothetical protein [Salipiger sp. PrR003]
MEQPINHIVVPLFFFLSEDGGSVSLSDHGGEGTPVNSDNYLKLLAEGMEYEGSVLIWLTDTVEEADAIEMAWQATGELNPDLAEAIKLPSGHGVVMRKNPDSAFELIFEDKRRAARTAGVPSDEVHASWDLDHKQMLTMQSTDELEMERQTRAWASSIAEMALHMPAHAIQQLQVDLESFPGAYVSFCSQDLTTLAETHEIEFKNDAAAHAALRQAASKYENSMFMSDVEDHAMERLSDLTIEEEPEVPAAGM